MTKALTILFLTVAMVSFSATADADMYKWTDDNGVVHFSDAPPANGRQVDTLKTTGTETTERDVGPIYPQNDSQPDEEQDETETGYNEDTSDDRFSDEVELFTTSWCPYCKNAVAFLRSNNIAFREYDVEKDRRAAMRMRTLGGPGSVPFALINGKTVLGFSPDAYRQALGLRR